MLVASSVFAGRGWLMERDGGRSSVDQWGAKHTTEWNCAAEAGRRSQGDLILEKG